MARQKKIVRYIPQTEIPKSNQEWRLIEKEGITFASLIESLKAHHAAMRAKHGPDAWLQYGNYVKQWDAGELTEANYRSVIPDWRWPRFCAEIFRHTDLFRQINEKFMLEFDSREDLQDIYKRSVNHARWVYTASEEHIDLYVNKTHAYCTRPETFKMFQNIVGRHGRSIIELARETPYVEGDLVLLRDTAIDRDCDPLAIRRWSTEYRNGLRTPDKSTQRIGTVISVTDQISQSWRPVKGSKVLKIMWLGGDGRVVDVEERWVKWHMRPTLKNGLKVRPTE